MLYSRLKAVPEATSPNVHARRVKTAINAVFEEIDPITKIKQEHEYVLTEYLGKDVVTVPPTGFGKSLIGYLVPMVMKKMFPGTNPILKVVSPLVALKEDLI